MARPSSDGVPPELDRGLLALSTRRPVAMLMVVATVLVFGVISLRQLPRNLMPDISYPTITVRTDYPGAAPVDVEDRISERLESVLAQVKNLRRVSSVSRAEVSEIILEFVWGTDMGEATMEIREKVDQAILPDEVERPIILRYDPTLDPVLQLGFYVERDPGGAPRSPDQEIEELIQLRFDAEEVVERELELVPGVAAIQVRGGYEKEIRIDVDEKLLPARGVSMELISRRLAEENQNLASGILYRGDDALIVRSVNEFEKLDEIREIRLRDRSGVPVRLRDVARVYFGYRDPEVLTRYNGAPCVKIEVYREADANIVEVARRVRDRIFGTEAERKLLARMKEEERIRDAEAGSHAARKEKEKKKEGEGKRRKTRGGRSFGLIPMGTGPRRPDFVADRLEGGQKLVVLSDQSRFVQNALDEVSTTVVTGGLLAVAVLFLFLRSSWFTVIVGMAIPLSVITTFTALKICGVSLNIMSLGGLALGVGMLVDNSIVVLESIFRCRQEGDSSRLAAVRGGKAVASAVTASTLTTVAVFFPIVFVEGIAGQVFRDQALAVVISLVVSLGVSLTFIPTLVARQLPVPGSRGDGAPPGLGEFHFHSLAHLRTYFRGSRVWIVPLTLLVVALRVLQLLIECIGFLLLGLAIALLALLRGLARLWNRLLGGALRALFRAFDGAWTRVETSYPPLIRGALRQRGAVILGALACAAVAGLLFTRLGSELIPEVHQGEFTVEVALPVGTRIERTDEKIQPLEARVRGLPGVRSLTGTVGVEKDSLKAGEEGEHTARLLVRVDPTRPPAEVEEEVKAGIREIFARLPDVTVKIRNPVLFSFKTPIEVEIKGQDLDTLYELASALKEKMDDIPSIKDVKSSLQRGYPELQLRFRRDILVRHGLDIGTVGNAIRRKIEGEVPTRFTERDRKIDLRVRLREADRSSLEDFSSILVNPGDDVELPLSYVADIERDFGPSEIRRIGQSRAAVVSANLAGLDLGRATESILGAVAELERPPEYRVDFGGQQSELESSRRNLTWALVLAVFLVYAVMAAQFESLLQPLVILFSIPLAAVGIAPVLWAFDISLSVIVFVGLIILAGIVVNNAIVLIDCINQLRRGGMAKLEAIAAAGRIRLRPILMTTATTVLGLLPLTGALSSIPGAAAVLGVGEGLEIRAPMAITVIAGLVSSTLLTLVVVPVVYSFVDRRE